jgi:NAD(P)-dependent dehydrogenase (short-subunit alcohol dehydrogenase family)
MPDLSDATAVVTGGGGPNIGRAISTRLASEGATVLVVDVDADGARETIDRIEAHGGDAAFFECDLTDVAAVGSVVDAIADEFGAIDVLVNNAGGATGLRIDEIDEPTFDANLARNLKSAFFVTKHALPHLRAGDGGSVVFVSSVNALLGGFSEVAYAVAKAGLHALGRSLTADHAGEGVRFNTVCPGSVIGDSPVWERREADDPGTLERIEGLYPVGRYGEPDDVADAVRFLASDDAAWISGVVLPVDGGLTATGGLPGGRWWEGL